MRYTSLNSLHVDGETKSLVGRAVIIRDRLGPGEALSPSGALYDLWQSIHQGGTL
jgi:hypothetical protein